MPIKDSSIRDLRLSRKRAAYNRRIRQHLQYLIHRCRKLAAAKDAAANSAVAAAVKAMDRAVRAGVLKAGTADRRKSRLMRVVRPGGRAA